MRPSAPAPRCCAPSRPRRSASGMAARFAPSARPVADELRGARSRHQQLPAADRAPQRRRVSRRRCVLAHRPARRGARGERRAVRGGDGAHDRGAARLRRQDRPAQGRRSAAMSRPRRAGAPSIAATSSPGCATRSGIEIEIISTAEEARLVVTGCAPLLHPRIPLCDRVRYRRRLDRDRLAAPVARRRAPGAPPSCRSSARCRCRSAS